MVPASYVSELDTMQGSYYLSFYLVDSPLLSEIFIPLFIFWLSYRRYKNRPLFFVCSWFRIYSIGRVSEKLHFIRNFPLLPCWAV